MQVNGFVEKAAGQGRGVRGDGIGVRGEGRGLGFMMGHN